MSGDDFRGLMKKYMEKRHVRTMEDLRSHTTIASNKTFTKYWKCPELFPIGEIENMLNALNVPNEERMELFKR